MHWDKVDNYRIDKYLMLLRYQLHEVLLFLKANDYREDLVTWFGGLLTQLFKEENFASKGIPLQICDVFLQELNKTDGEQISCSNIAALLGPFLQALATCRNVILLRRIEEKVFHPMLDNNVTPVTQDGASGDDTDDSSSEINYDPKRGKWVDGGKLPPKTQKEI